MKNAHSCLAQRWLTVLLALSLIFLFGCAWSEASPEAAVERTETPVPITSSVQAEEEPECAEEEPKCAEEETLQLPILMYHHLTRGEEQSSSMMPEYRFRDQMRAISEAGYQPVGFDELRAWVEEGGELPEKPIVITFDDGYFSNYEIAYPILQEFGFKATIFVIGVSVGKNTYKDTGKPIIPHFSREQAEEMEASGLISIQSHGYNIHEQKNIDPEPLRHGILRREGESEEDYLAFLHEDCANMKELLGKTPYVLSYPHGVFDDLSDAVLSEEGVSITLTTQARMNTLIRGDRQCLWRMGRFLCNGGMSGEELLEMLEAAETPVPETN